MGEGGECGCDREVVYEVLHRCVKSSCSVLEYRTESLHASFLFLVVRAVSVRGGIFSSSFHCSIELLQEFLLALVIICSLLTYEIVVPMLWSFGNEEAGHWTGNGQTKPEMLEMSFFSIWCL